MRTALVTGGTRGIGAAISEAFHEAGYRVAATYAGNDDAARQFSDRTGISTFRWDVGDFAACQEGVARVSAGLGPIGVLVNNAGCIRDAMLHRATEEGWRTVIGTNLDSCFNMCRAVIGPMREAGFGRIVNISSINGLAGQLGQTNYAASKAGMIGFTRSLALEGAARGITVNAVAPGYISTDMLQAVPGEVLKKIVAGIPAGRLGEPREIARAVLFLAADESGFITGVTLSVNGGQYLH